MMDFEEFVRRSSSGDTSLIIPEGDFPGIGDIAEILERIHVGHPETFWNVRNRGKCENDRIFIALAIQAIKKQGNLRLVMAIPKIMAITSGSVSDLIDEIGERSDGTAPDSTWRFFPAIEDGRPDVRDLAVDKVLAFAGRDDIRNYYDLCQMMRHGESLGAYVVAACGKDEGYVPDLLLSELSFAARRWREEEFHAIDGERLDFVECRTMLNAAIRDARSALKSVPVEHFGHMLLDMDGKPFLPKNGERHVIHAISRHGSHPEFRRNPISKLEPEQDCRKEIEEIFAYPGMLAAMRAKCPNLPRPSGRSPDFAERDWDELVNGLFGKSESRLEGKP